MSPSPAPTGNDDDPNSKDGATVHEPCPIDGRPLEVAPSVPLETAIVEAGLARGFARVGCCSAEPFEREQSALARWTALGMHGSMSYLTEPSVRGEPERLLPGTRGIVSVALGYPGPIEARDAPPNDTHRHLPLTGSIAAYARFDDYHRLMRVRLRALADDIATLCGRTLRARACVDTAPLLERAVAARAGIGFTAKSTMVIAPGPGSYVLLGQLLVDVPLRDAALVTAGCGSCRRCLDACPTAAFTNEYQLDARRCVSYLTIEHGGTIPVELRSGIGTRIFGCDVCQAVCPFNGGRQAAAAPPGKGPKPDSVSLAAILGFSNRDHRRFVRGTSLARVSRARLQRNAAIALGNTRNAEAVPVLLHALETNPRSLVRVHVVWALGQLGKMLFGADREEPAAKSIRTALESVVASDPDLEVREEAAAALIGLDSPVLRSPSFS